MGLFRFIYRFFTERSDHDILGRQFTEEFLAPRRERRARQQAERERQRAQHEYEHQAGQREPAQRDAEECKRSETVAQRRRENVRARVELFYNLHAADIGTRFTQKMFDDYVNRYMSDSHEAAFVAQRAEQLLETMQQCLDKVAPPPRFKSLTEINQARQEERRMIREADLDEVTKEAHLIRLEEKYDEIVSRFFEEKGR